MAAEASAPPKPALSLVVPVHRALRIDVPHLVEYLDAGSAVVVDVRDQDHKGGHIPGATHVPYELFDTSLDDVLTKFADRSKKYVLYCMYSRERAPVCAEVVLAKLAAAGGEAPLPDVHVLTGGFNAWVNAWCTTAVDEKSKAATFAVADPKRLAAFDAAQYQTVVEGGVARVVYKRDVDDHSYSIKTPLGNQSGAFAAKK